MATIGARSCVKSSASFKSTKKRPQDHNEYVSSLPESRRRESARQFALSIAIIGTCTVIALLLRPHIAATNLVMVYLFGVVAIATRCSKRMSVLASFLSVAAFDFFCVPPYLTFRVHDYEYLITFAGMLMVALVISA